MVSPADDREVDLHAEREDEDADHDRRESVEDVEPEADLRADGLRRELADVDRRQYPERQCHRRGDQDQEQTADERRRNTATGTEEHRPLGEEIPAERPDAT